LARKAIGEGGVAEGVSGMVQFSGLNGNQIEIVENAGTKVSD